MDIGEIIEVGKIQPQDLPLDTPAPTPQPELIPA